MSQQISDFSETAKDNRPTSESDFEKWYEQTGGDPWGYDHPAIQERLDKSVEFLKKQIPDNFDGIFLEIGAFNGAFTDRLINTFHNAKVVINDFSESALDKVKQKFKENQSVSFLKKDMRNLCSNDNENINNSEIIVVMLECLYYVTEEDRGKVISNIKNEFNKPKIFLSAPVTGKPYFTKKSLLKMFYKNNYELIDSLVINRKKAGVNFKNRIRKYINYILNRYSIPNQTIFYFR